MRPLFAKRFESFSVNREESTVSSGHSTFFCFKLRKEDQGVACKWLLKEIGSSVSPAIAEIEAAMAGLYALIEPDRIPKVRAIYKAESLESSASVSKLFPSFYDLESYLNTTTFTEDVLDSLVDAGIAEILAMSYFFEEDDLHKKNIGFSGNSKKLVRVDFDMSAYVMVSRSDLRGPRSYTFRSATPEKTFDITARDLSQFPKLVDADPHYFPTKYRVNTSPHAYSSHEVSVFLALSHHADFFKRSYQTFLKIILMPEASFKKTIAAFIPQGNNQATFQDHFIARKQKLKIELIKTLKFRSFWQASHKVVFEKIIHDIAQYNASLKDKYSELRVDLDLIRKNYDELCLDMEKIFGVPVSEVDELAHDLIVWLNKDEHRSIAVRLLESIVAAHTAQSAGYLSWLSYGSGIASDQMKKAASDLSAAKTTNAFLQVMSQLFSHESEEQKNISKVFIAKLIPLLERKKIAETDMSKLVAALIDAMQPDSRSNDGWEEVSHCSSNNFLEGSFSKPAS
ncbi:MAG: hypothetical protein COY58_02535 [Gammaproteobacteria bacterium CG_4_10_14_0_8_um_filter_38_16]|nr:MAG: hypothetical protein COY58_02535 [Gammaproteobacteria bacterium CG_4_10_14_0_8_um_filter_38_16]PJA03810.1 MAG: hypothetical protein COX72_02695 [Gammaproteobacteria bacterium CG_4_10_14_0_2_um_filter_38_22]PJB10784.1 MAG: hypothetical protein CO120_02800 [Gammaproteobacteria bacterium CG_4_9_14_3_um_filter_38_9]